MVAPITGPYEKSLVRSEKGRGSYFRYQWKYKQAKPYNLDLPYQLNVRKCLQTDGSALSPDNAAAASGNPAAGGVSFYDCYSSVTYDARFKAMQRLRGQISERAEWLVNLAERKQAANMVTSRALQLLAYTVAVARRDFGGISRALSTTVKSSKTKDLGGLWLEYHFGWKPMIQDIFTGIDILQQPIANKRVKGSAKESKVYTYAVEETNYRTYAYRRLSNRAKVCCSFEVSNPNLWRANQLGLINPAKLAWELIPFSFVVDWFIPVSGFLESFTEWVGLRVFDKSTTILTEDLIDYRLTPKVSGIGSAYALNQGFSMHRVLSLPEASLRPPTPGRISVTRAATAISLLLQQMKSF